MPAAYNIIALTLVLPWGLVSKMIKLISIIILLVLAGCVEVPAGNETETPDCPDYRHCPGCVECPFCEDCPTYTIAYVNNCATGKTDKYICVDGEDCKSTEDILSELG